MVESNYSHKGDSAFKKLLDWLGDTAAWAYHHAGNFLYNAAPKWFNEMTLPKPDGTMGDIATHTESAIKWIGQKMLLPVTQSLHYGIGATISLAGRVINGNDASRQSNHNNQLYSTVATTSNQVPPPEMQIAPPASLPNQRDQEQSTTR
ncbi:MAG: hypothetical protein F6K62_11455 [Sphaerospermopsis sp. SIO1G2]|nr:hypothetical protein [Sphaerospermopsis sp. SIO1G2]